MIYQGSNLLANLFFLSNNLLVVREKREKYMLSFAFKFLALIVMLFSHSDIYAVFVASTVEVHLSIEDGDLQQGPITCVKFDCEEMDISKKSFMNRKVSKVFNVSPGQYEIEWITEKNEKPWGGEKKIKKHRKMVVFELTDAVVHINIRGETLTTY